MTRISSFHRKVIYLSAIALLLIPLSYLCQPATFEKRESADGIDEIEEVRARGKLAQLRVEYDLSQASLGDVDPASETMKLATLGMRGVAANFLWAKAQEYKKTEAFDKASATVNQIIKLQPNFAKVWEFQAHNLAYNISVEFDNYKHRYEWIKKGIRFLMKGTRYNRKEPKMATFTGFMIGNKIGKSDEQLLYRNLYRDDHDFHAELARFFPKSMDLEREVKIRSIGHDNWQMARLWYEKAEDMVEKGALLRGEGHSVFFSKAPMQRLQCAISFEKEFPPWPDQTGVSVAQQLWKDAGAHWNRYGERDLLTYIGTHVRLNQMATQQQALKDAQAELDSLVPNVRQRMAKEKRDLLKKDQPALFDALVAFENSVNPLVDLTQEEIDSADSARRLVDVSDTAVRAEASDANNARVSRVMGKIQDIKERIRLIDSNRSVMNFDYWELRCSAESTQSAILARQYLYDADQLFDLGHWMRRVVTDDDGEPIPELDDQGNPVLTADGKPVHVIEDGALENYEKAWSQFADLFSDPNYATLLKEIDGQNLVPYIKKYRKLLIDLKLRRSEKELPTNFPIMSLLDFRKGEDGLPTPSEIITTQTAEARRLMREAKDKLETDPAAARESYDKAWTEWARLFDVDPGLMIHSATDDLVDAIDEYRALVEKPGADGLSDDFSLAPYIEIRKAHKLSAAAIKLADDDAEGALEAFDPAWQEWAQVVENQSRLMDDARVVKHLVGGIKRHRKLVIESGTKELTPDFPLINFLNHRAGKDDLPIESEILEAHGTSPAKNEAAYNAAEPTSDIE